MREDDLEVEFVKKLSTNFALYHVINRGGVPYSIIVDVRNKEEILSCEREKEAGMIECFESSECYEKE